jgi:hypothetical protein
MKIEEHGGWRKATKEKGNIWTVGREGKSMNVRERESK